MTRMWDMLVEMLTSAAVGACSAALYNEQVD